MEALTSQQFEGFPVIYVCLLERLNIILHKELSDNKE